MIQKHQTKLSMPSDPLSININQRNFRFPLFLWTPLLLYSYCDKARFQVQNIAVHTPTHAVPFFFPFCSRLWGAYAHQVSVAVTVEIGQMCVKASPASLGWTASVRESQTVSPVERAPLPPSPRTDRATSALRTVCFAHFFQE